MQSARFSRGIGTGMADPTTAGPKFSVHQESPQLNKTHIHTYTHSPPLTHTYPHIHILSHTFNIIH